MNKELLRTIKFTLFSISAGIIQIGSYTLLYEVCGLTHWISYLISLVLSVIWNFTLNRNYTFKSANNIPKAMFLVFLYYLVFTPVSTVLGKYLVDTLKWNNYVVEILTMLANFVTEFLYDRFIVFGKSLDTREVKK